MWVKICGNTRLEDCVAAAELGADAVGFVFAAGKRTVTAPQVAAITSKLPVALEKIGVFTTLHFDQIVAAVEQGGLTGVQLHSGEPAPGLLRRLRAYFGETKRCSIIQVTHRWTDITEAEQGTSFAATVGEVVQAGGADALLVDSRTHEGSGGTGRVFDWEAAKPALTGLPIRVILAGGLRPENVADGVRVLSPWGVDVSSGVETAPGVKDRDAIARFIENARSV